MDRSGLALRFKSETSFEDDEPTGAVQRKGYHVGNLRTVLLDKALEMLEEEGLAALSLRKVAAGAGVSIGALYHHFESKAELLGQLACLGFRELRAAILAADAKSDGRHIRACVLTLFSFASQRRALHELMSDPDILDAAAASAAYDEAMAAVEEVMRRAAAHRQAQRLRAPSEDDIHNIALAVWACTRGAALLALSDGGELATVANIIKGLVTLFELRNAAVEAVEPA